MVYDIKKIFLPSVGVDLVLNTNSLMPSSRSSIIYDVDFKKKSITIAQPLTPLSGETDFDELHLTTIVKTPQNKLRVGIKCYPIKFIDQYQLANQSTAKAVTLQYDSPIAEINIRSAFRLPLSTRHSIKAKLIHRKAEYYTARDFSIRDISLTGMSLVIPRRSKYGPNRLIELKINEIFPVGLILVDKEKDKPVGTFPVKTRIVRLNTNYSKTQLQIGLKIIAIAKENETTLNQFIHQAQIDELTRLRIRNL